MDIKRISVIIGIALGLVALFGLPIKAVDYLKTNFVDMDKFGISCEKIELASAQIKAVNKRLDQSLDLQVIRSLDDRNWDLEKRYGTRDPLKMPEDVKDEYRRNINKVKELKDKWGFQ